MNKAQRVRLTAFRDKIVKLAATLNFGESSEILTIKAELCKIHDALTREQLNAGPGYKIEKECDALIDADSDLVSAVACVNDAVTKLSTLLR